MFKKPVKISAQNQLSGKDRKTMRNKLAELFDQVCVDKVMNVNDKIISCKTSGSKMIIYNGNDYPLFVDGTGKNDYFPSLYTAIAYEPLIKVLQLNQGVESYIYNGANLMWPGVRDYLGLGNFEKDQIVGIRTAKGQLIAIGAMGSSLKEFQGNADKSGIAVYILHYFNDHLWAQGPKMKPEIIVAAEKPKPKEEKKQQQPKKTQKQAETNEKVQKKGKKQQQTKPEAKKVQQQPKEKGKKEEKQKKNKKQKEKSQSEQQPKKKQQSESQSDGQIDFSSLVHRKGVKPSLAQPVKIQKKGQQKVTFVDDDQNDKKAKKKQGKKQQPKEQGKKKAKKQSDEQQQGEAEEPEVKGQQQKSTVSTKLMDQQFKQSFLNALKLSKVQGQLPIDSGRFFMDFMLLARPPGVKLEIKDTSYKKLGKFYEEMAKQKFIQFKHNKDKKGQQGSTIVKILWENKELRDYEPTILKMNQKDVQEKEDVSDSKKKLKLSQTLQVENVYKLHQNFKNAVFAKRVNYAPTQQQEKQMKKQEQQAKNQPQFYTQNQVRALIQKYINDKLVPKRDKDKKQDKEKKTDKMVTIDYKNNPYLADLLKKQIEEFEENVQVEPGDSDEEQQGKKNKKKKERIMRIDRGALVNRILKTCSTSYLMKDKQNNVESFHQGTFKGIQLVAQKSNNKNITKIIGLETFIVPKSQIEEQIHGFANLLKEKFACSVNVQNLPGRNAGKEIIVHGNFINQLEQMFTEEYKLKDDYITSQNKLDKKKKR